MVTDVGLFLDLLERELRDEPWRTHSCVPRLPRLFVGSRGVAMSRDTAARVRAPQRTKV